MPIGHYAKRAYRVERLLSLGAAVGGVTVGFVHRVDHHIAFGSEGFGGTGGGWYSILREGERHCSDEREQGCCCSGRRDHDRWTCGACIGRSHRGAGKRALPWWSAQCQTAGSTHSCQNHCGGFCGDYLYSWACKGMYYCDIALPLSHLISYM